MNLYEGTTNLIGSAEGPQAMAALAAERTVEWCLPTTERPVDVFLLDACARHLAGATTTLPERNRLRSVSTPALKGSDVREASIHSNRPWQAERSAPSDQAASRRQSQEPGGRQRPVGGPRAARDGVIQ